MTHFNNVKQRNEAGIAKDCMATYSLSHGGDQGLTDVEVAYSLSAPFSAGVDTVRRFLLYGIVPRFENDIHRHCQLSNGLLVSIWRSYYEYLMTNIFDSRCDLLPRSAQKDPDRARQCRRTRSYANV